MAVLLVLATVALYAPVRDYAFLNYDDDLYVTASPEVQGGLSREGLGWALRTPVAGIWHPLTLLSHMLDVELFGLDPAGHHLSSVFLHAANVLLLFALLLRTTGALWRSAFAAALFALHPLQVESVAWVAERKNVLALTLLLLTCHAYVGWCRRRGPWRYAAVVGLFGLSLAAKPMGVVLPFALLLLDYWPLGRLGQGGRAGVGLLGARIVEKLPLFALSAASCAVALWPQDVALAPLEVLGLPTRLANASVAYLLYGLRTVWPAGLCVLYPHPGPALPAGWVAASGLAGAAVTLAVLAAARRAPALLVGWLWFLGCMVPVIGLVQVGAQASADRYMYLPGIGLFIAAAWVVPDGWARGRGRWVLAGSAGAVLLALGAVTAATLPHWRSSVSLFERALAATRDAWIPYPESSIAHFNLAAAYAREGRDEDAARHYARALELGHDPRETRLRLGNALMRLERFEAAAAVYRAALARDPEHGEARLHLAAAFAKQGRFAEAADALAAYLAAHPDDAEARVHWIDALARSGRAAEALEAAEAAAAARPEDPITANNLAWLLATSSDPQLRDPGRAVAIAERLRDTGTPSPGTLDTLAAAYAAAGRFDAAGATALEAAELAEARGEVELAGRIRRRRAGYAAGLSAADPSGPEQPGDTGSAQPGS